MNSKISHSAIKDYQSCPLLFFYRHVLDLQDPFPSIHLTFGKSLHLGLELMVKEKADPVKVFKESFTPDKLSREDKLKYLDLSAKGKELLTEYVQRKQLGIKVIKTEEKIKMINVIDPVTKTKLLFETLTGIIDFEIDGNIIGDYKTSGKPYKQLDVDESLQPTVYYLLYYLKYGRLPEKFIYVVFLKKRKKEKIQILETKRDFSDFPKLIKICNEIYTKVEQRRFKRLHGESQRCDCYRYEEMLRV